MKLITACMLFLLLFVSACNRGPRTTRAANDADLASQEREAYEARVEARLDDMEHRFDGLEARSKGMDKAGQERLQTDVDELRDRKDALEQKVRDLHKVSDQSWMDVKASLDRDIEQLESVYNVVSTNNQ